MQRYIGPLDYIFYTGSVACQSPQPRGANIQQIALPMLAKILQSICDSSSIVNAPSTQPKMGILYGSGDATVWQTLASSFTAVTGMSFLVFNLLCAPCFAAMGAIKREMNNAKWFWFAIGYECGFAYVIALMINYFGKLFTGALAGAGDIIGLIVAVLLLAALIYLLVRPYKESKKLGVKVKVTK